MGSDGVIALSHLAANLPSDSATRLKESGYEGIDEWSARFKTNVLLADLYDALAAFVHVYVKSKSKKKQKPPKPYPRPWVEEKGKKRIGRGAIPIKDFWNWWNDGEC